MMHSLRVLSYLEHFKVTDEGVAGGEVVPKHHDAPAGLAPHVAEAVVGEVGDPGPGGDVDPAVRAQPALGTQTHTWDREHGTWDRTHGTWNTAIYSSRESLLFL